MVNTDSQDGFERTVYEDFSDLPYASWKLGTGTSLSPIKTKFFTLPIALQMSTENMSRSILELEQYSTLNPYFG